MSLALDSVKEEPDRASCNRSMLGHLGCWWSIVFPARAVSHFAHSEEMHEDSVFPQSTRSIFPG